MENKPIARSVKNLQELYTVVIGLSLAAGIHQIVDFSASGFPIHFDRLPLFAAYLALVVPVYHGAMRHLDVAHIENVSKPLALVFDFFILFIEGCFFLLLAGLVPYTYKFLSVLVSLLLLIPGRPISTPIPDIPRRYRPVTSLVFISWVPLPWVLGEGCRTWGLLNLITSGMLVLVYLYCDSLNVSKPAEYYLQISTLVIVVIRTVIDYCLCWSLYYPNKDV